MAQGVLTERDLSGQSALARELATLRPATRQRLGIDDELIVLVDAFFAVLRALDDGADGRPWQERIEAALEGLRINSLDEEYAEKLVAGLHLAADEKTIERFKSFSPGSFKPFMHRLLGEGAYQRLMTALRLDGGFAVAAIRKGLRNVMPLALAFDDSVAFLSQEQLAQVEGMDKLTKSVLTVAIELDSVLDQVATKGLAVEDISVSEEALEAGESLDALIHSVQEVLVGQSREALEELSEKLSRKIKGARDVLGVSADANSQAASSLVEFVDRLLRNAFDDATVLEFVATRFPNEPGLTYKKDGEGKSLPTKKAQALCFVYAGQTSGDSIPIIEIAASGVVKARTVLQGIKHADEGTQEETETVLTAVKAVEGFFMFAVRVGWATVGTQGVAALRTRLGE